MKRKLIVSVLGTCVVTAIVTTFIVENLPERTSDGKPAVTSVLRSRVLAEERELIVHLPESYERFPARRYPVLIVLDGSSQDGHTAESARFLARIGVMPEIIVVGVPNTSGQGRQRDYTPPFMRADEENGAAGGADRFLRFLETELIPHLDRTYRTTATRMLAGNSRGGLFVVYSLVERPDLFSARFAYSPALWRDDQRIVAELAKSLKARRDVPTFLYLSLGDGENQKMTRAFRKTVDVVKASAPPQLRWRADVTPGAVHRDNAVRSTPVGLSEYYRQAPERVGEAELPLPAGAGRGPG